MTMVEMTAEALKNDRFGAAMITWSQGGTFTLFVLSGLRERRESASQEVGLGGRDMAADNRRHTKMKHLKIYICLF